MFLEYIFFLTGLNILLGFLLKIIEVAKSLLLKADYSHFYHDTWALVTACTDGLGLGFSEELAKKGFNIIQVGRNLQKLNYTGQMLKDKYNIQVFNVVKDFSLCHENPIEFFQDICDQVKHLHIGILVNNVGTGNCRELIKTDVSTVLNQLSLNVFPVIFLTRLLMNHLSQQRAAGIINVNSAINMCPIQRNVVYAATKALGFCFGEIVRAECQLQEKNPIKFLCILPGLVETPSVEYIKRKPLSITKYQCASKAINLLGVIPYCNGHPKHLLVYFISYLTMPLIPWLGGHITKTFEKKSN